MIRPLFILSYLPLAFVLAGCVSPGSQTLPFAISRIDGGNAQAVFATAQIVLTDLGYALDEVDPVGGTLTTRGITESRRNVSSQKVVRLSPQAELRRVVQMRVGHTGDAVTIYCQVAIQELDTESYRIMQQQLGSSERAGETAIDRGAGTTVEQNTVWRTIERDKARERNILEAVLDRSGRTVSAP